ncbi:hydrolase [Burkholderia sp. WAC0059]|uniref:CocE/NonD family hydrolase n=1 Tax=Burkholderia sp. WAC0059 TaxID=2066022 RepID=UPI000C7EF949|nr:CocE/NonD family hydrolase [Burkholderia sp. WAC0059]PLZ02164.1 hydrolase [Burkholderia sp. WAC0059]
MSDRETNGLAWRIHPGEYLKQAGQPAYRLPAKPQSVYVPMRDGCKLAVDVYVPQSAAEAANAKFPAILVFTPYYRRWELGNAGNGENSPNAAAYRDIFVPHGYALVVVDVRGTGASFGTRDSFRSPKEREDSREIVDWVIAQKWSNGLVGATGISYLGAASDFLASTGHPAVRAIAPISGVWDTYADHYYPGGVYQNKLAFLYGDMSIALDTADVDQLRKFAYYKDPNLVGPAPTDGDAEKTELRKALAEHRSNFYMPDYMDRLEFRENPYVYDEHFHSGAISPYWYREGIRPDVAVLSVCGWMDGCGYTNGSIARFLTLGKTNQHCHLLIGPWDHGARINHSPWRNAELPEFNIYAEILRFFDKYLKGRENGYQHEQSVHYFALKDEKWHAASGWPPQPAADWHLALDSLHVEGGGSLVVAPTFATGSGNHTRYERIAAIDCRDYYPDWDRQIDAMLTLKSEPVAEDRIIAGHVELDIWVESDKKDFALFAYLSEQEADGTVRYITEGMLRAGHRKSCPSDDPYVASWTYRSFALNDYEPVPLRVPVNLKIPLHPISWQLSAGSRLVLSLAQTDSDHFAQIPPGQPAALTVVADGDHPSGLSVPVLQH